MEFTNTSLLRRFGDLRTPTAQSPSATVVVETEKGSIVLGENDPVERDHLATILRNLGYEVFTSGDGREALQLVQDHDPLLVIASLHLSGLDGYKLSKMLREAQATESIPFMFIVDSGELPDQVIGHETYAHDYIQKPISLPDFNFRVNALLRMAKRSRVNSAHHQNKQNGFKPDPVSGLILQPGKTQDTEQHDPQFKAVQQEKLSELLDQIQRLLTALGTCFGELQRQLKGQPLENWAREGKVPLPQETGTEDYSHESHASKGQGMNSETVKQQEELEQQDTGEKGPVSGPISEESTVSVSSSRTDESDGLAMLEEFRKEYRERAGSGSIFKATVASSPVIDDILENFFPKKTVNVPAIQDGAETTSEVSQDVSADDGNHASTIAFDPALIERQAEASEALETPDLEAVEAREDLSPQALYKEAEAWVNHTLDKVRSGEQPDPVDGRRIVEQIRQALEKSPALVLLATDRTQAYSIAAHSVNVAILAVWVGKAFGNHPQEFQTRTGLAGLIHEIGVVRLPAGLLHKKEALTPQELKILRNRPLQALQILETTQAGYSWLAEVVGQVYERRNGKGYPLGLRSAQLSDEAQLLGLVDLFEACIHQRPYRTPLTGYKALYTLSADQEGTFTEELIRALIQAVSLFPPNEYLRLSSGELVQVIDLNPDNLSRPVVKVIQPSTTGNASPGVKIDLSRREDLKISKVLSYSRCKELGLVE